MTKLGSMLSPGTLLVCRADRIFAGRKTFIQATVGDMALMLGDLAGRKHTMVALLLHGSIVFCDVEKLHLKWSVV